MDVNWISSWFLIRRIKQNENPILHCYLLVYWVCLLHVTVRLNYPGSTSQHAAHTTTPRPGFEPRPVTMVYVALTFFVNFCLKILLHSEKNVFHYTHCKLSKHEMIASFHKWTAGRFIA